MAVKPASAAQARRENALFSLMLALRGICSCLPREQNLHAVMKKHPKNQIPVRLLGC
jgi:hypothetical protein